MSLTTQQQDFVTQITARFAAFVAAVSDAFEADNAASTTTLADAKALRDGLNALHDQISLNLYGYGVYSFDNGTDYEPVLRGNSDPAWSGQLPNL